MAARPEAVLVAGMKNSSSNNSLHQDATGFGIRAILLNTNH
jgi:hypothetical protein